MSNSVESCRIVSNLSDAPPTHSQLKKRRKLGIATPDELIRLRQLDAAHQQRRRSKAKEPQEPLTREQEIALLQSKMKDTGAKPAAALQRRIDLLRGTDRPYATKAADREERDRALQPKTGGLPRSCFQGIWYVQMVERMAGIEQRYTGAVDSLIARLTSAERKQFQAQADRVALMSPEERESWEDAELTEHPLWSPPVRPEPVATQIKPASELEERAKLLALIKGAVPQPQPDILAPEELSGTPQPMTPDVVNRLNEFWQFNSTL